MILALTLAACDGGAGTPTTEPTDSGTTPTFTLPGAMEIGDEHQYTYTGEWTFPSSEVRSANQIFVSWDTHTQDAWGEVRAADSYDTLLLFELTGSAPAAADLLSLDQLSTVEVGRWSLDVTAEVSAQLGDLVGFDPFTQLTEDDSRSWLLALADTVGPRTDLRDGMFLVPRDAQPGTLITIPDGVASYTWTSKIDGETLRTDADRDDYSLDWTALTLDPSGEPFDPAAVDEVFVGRFDDVAEADDLGSDIHDLRAVASGWWTLGNAGFPYADLAEARDDAGAAFPGFTSGTSWLVGGRCTTCLGPAPKFVVVVEVREP